MSTTMELLGQLNVQLVAPGLSPEERRSISLRIRELLDQMDEERAAMLRTTQHAHAACMKELRRSSSRLAEILRA